MEQRQILYPIFRVFTANYYVWLVSVWLLGPVIMVLTFFLFLGIGLKDLVVDTAREWFVPLAYSRKQWLKLHERYRRA
jgi:hypothetical protein